MTLIESIVGGLVGAATGALTGVGAAIVTTRGKVKELRTEFEGKLQLLREGRSYELDDRAAKDQAAAAAASAEEERALRAAATGLVNALRNPDAFNLSKAHKDVGNATIAFAGKGEMADLAQRLQQASQEDDSNEAELILRRLGDLGE